MESLRATCMRSSTRHVRQSRSRSGALRAPTGLEARAPTPEATLARRCGRFALLRRPKCRRGARQAQSERAPLPYLALQGDPAVERLDQALDDEQAEPDAAVLSADRLVGLTEGLEDRVLGVRGMPMPVSRDGDLDRSRSLRRRAARSCRCAVNLQALLTRLVRMIRSFARVGDERADVVGDLPAEGDAVAARRAGRACAPRSRRPRRRGPPSRGRAGSCRSRGGSRRGSR